MPDRKPTVDERNVWMGMARLVAHLTREVNHAVHQAEGINLSEMTLLGQLRQIQGTARMSDLAQRLQLTKPAITKITRRLEHAGYLARKPDPQDGRATSILLTTAGVAVLTRAEHLFEAEMRERLWDRLAPGEAQALAQILNRVQADLGLAPTAVMPP